MEYDKIWKSEEVVTATEMNKISNILQQLVIQTNKFSDDFPSSNESISEKIKNYIDSYVIYDGFESDNSYTEPNITNETTNFNEIANGFYSPSTENEGSTNAITELEKRCDHIEKILKAVGTRTVEIGNASTGIIKQAQKWADDSNIVMTETDNTKEPPVIINHYSAKHYAEEASTSATTAQNWATSDNEIDTQNNLYSAKYYAMDAANSAASIAAERNFINNLKWSSNNGQASTLILENCIIPGVSMDSGRQLVFNIDLGKVIDTEFTSTISDTNFNGLDIARDLSIDTESVESGTSIPQTQIRLYAKDKWLLNYNTGYNALNKNSGYYINTRGAAAGPITHKIIIHKPVSSLISLILINNNYCKGTNSTPKTIYSAGYGFPGYNSKAKNTGGGIGGGTQVLMFVKKLVIKYTPYTEPSNNENPSTPE